MNQTETPALNMSTKPRLLIFIVAYHAESTISSVLARIPHSLVDKFHIEVLIIDDASKDETFEIGLKIARDGNLPFQIHVLFNPANQGYGGNQKIGYHYAIENGFDFLIVLLSLFFVQKVCFYKHFKVRCKSAFFGVRVQG